MDSFAVHPLKSDAVSLHHLHTEKFTRLFLKSLDILLDFSYYERKEISGKIFKKVEHFIRN